MSFAENIKALRKQNNLSQEKFAEIMEITRQAVQKWEAGTAMPDLYNLCTISKKFSISVDSLILDSNRRAIDNLEYDKTIQPEYSAIHRWENYSEQLLLEYRQSVEEGKDIEEYKDMFHAVQKVRPGKNKSDIADILFRIVLNAPVVQGYEYLEPSEFEMIKANRKPYGTNLAGIDKQALRDKITGAWIGRICGCLLGKVVEGVRTDKLIPFLKETGNFPMHRYILASDITDKLQEKYTLRLNRNNCADRITCAPADDDTNYTVLAQIIVQCGLAQIPYTSRLYKAVTEVITGFKAGVSQKECFDKIHTAFDEHDGHDWCHTIPNALIVTASLLYGGGNYGKSICMAVETGFDTDCNGATTGSILGMRNGASAIDSKWTAPVQDTLDTQIFGVGKVRISECVEKTLSHIE